MTAPDLQIIPPHALAEPVRFRADRALLSGTLHRPNETVKAAIVLHSATAVPHRYYRYFAKWLAARGYACLTWDYRDFAASAKEHVRGSKAAMFDWGAGPNCGAEVCRGGLSRYAALAFSIRAISCGAAPRRRATDVYTPSSICCCAAAASYPPMRASNSIWSVIASITGCGIRAEPEARK